MNEPFGKIYCEKTKKKQEKYDLTNYIQCLSCGEIFYYSRLLINLPSGVSQCPFCNGEHLRNIKLKEFYKLNQERYNPSRKDNGYLINL